MAYNDEYYEEYPIRCKSCNEQIACYAADYKLLLEQGLSAQEALDELGIFFPCSRKAMMDPVKVFFNMENRDLINGYKTTKAVDLDKGFIESTLERQKFPPPVRFPPGEKINMPTPQSASVPKREESEIRKRAVGVMERPTTTFKPVIPVSGDEGRAPRSPGTVLAGRVARSQGTGLGIRPVGKTAQLKEIAPEINIKIESKEYEEPKIPGIPTINPDPDLPQIFVDVGSDRKCFLLNGRTYLGR